MALPLFINSLVSPFQIILIHVRPHNLNLHVILKLFENACSCRIAASSGIDSPVVYLWSEIQHVRAILADLDAAAVRHVSYVLHNPDP